MPSGNGRLKSHGSRGSSSSDERRSESFQTSGSGSTKHYDDTSDDAVTSLKSSNMQLSLRGSLGCGSEIWAFCEVDENEGKQEEVWGKFWQEQRSVRAHYGEMYPVARIASNSSPNGGTWAQAASRGARHR